LRQRFDPEPGERVAIVAKNSPDYLELMFGVWHAGTGSNAKLDGREFAYIMEHSGGTSKASGRYSSLAFVSRRTDSMPRSPPMRRQRSNT
jgi:acyl-CoA synthetase (AMP-forming)/AMP-acid ligase II